MPLVCCRALAKLYTGGGQTPRFPVAFLTNGGGVTEEHKAEQLSQWLGVAVKPSQAGQRRVLLQHTGQHTCFARTLCCTSLRALALPRPLPRLPRRWCCRTHPSGRCCRSLRRCQ